MSSGSNHSYLRRNVQISDKKREDISDDKVDGQKTREDDLQRKNGTDTMQKSVESMSAWNSFWFQFTIEPARLTAFRFIFFIMLAFDGFEQIKRAPRYGAFDGFNLAHIGGHMPISPSIMVACRIAQFFLSIMCAFGVTKPFPDQFVLFGLNAYSYFISQINNFQHVYLLALVLGILMSIDFTKYVGNTPIKCWQIRLLLVQVSLVYLWTVITKLDYFWIFETTHIILHKEIKYMVDTTGYLKGSEHHLAAIIAFVTIVTEMLLGIAFLTWQYIGGKQTNGKWHHSLFWVGVIMHSIMGMSELKIGRFSYFMVILYILIMPSYLLQVTSVTISVIHKHFALPLGIVHSEHIGAFQPDSDKLKQHKHSASIVRVIMAILLVSLAIWLLPFELEGLWTGVGIASIVLLLSEYQRGWCYISYGRSAKTFVYTISGLACACLLIYTSQVTEFHSKKCQLLAIQNKLEDALACYNYCTQIDKQYINGYLGAADMHMKLEHWNKAWLSYQEVLNYEPDNIKSLFSMLDLLNMSHKSDWKSSTLVCPALMEKVQPGLLHLQEHCTSQYCLNNQNSIMRAISSARTFSNKLNCGT